MPHVRRSDVRMQLMTAGVMVAVGFVALACYLVLSGQVTF